jgi:hypothetical protein
MKKENDDQDSWAGNINKKSSALSIPSSIMNTEYAICIEPLRLPEGVVNTAFTVHEDYYRSAVKSRGNYTIVASGECVGVHVRH